MSGPASAATHEATPELALGILDGAARAEALMHLASCPSCQRYVDEMAGVADGSEPARARDGAARRLRPAGRRDHPPCASGIASSAG